MAISYKRTIIQIPLEDVKLFHAYAKNYGLSLSSAIIFLAKKSLEQEKVISQLPELITLIQQEKKSSSKKTKNNSKTSHLKKAI